MRYESVLPGIFLRRPNRFIAEVAVAGQVEICHVKNTGRCAELLIPGTPVYIQPAANPARKTRFDLITVQKGERLVNLDSQAPNKVFGEWLAKGTHFAQPTLIRPEAKYGGSRLDFYFEAGGQPGYAEVKGVTLEEDGVALFPDAPTLRGVRHLEELARCRAEGYRAVAAFIIQMKGLRYFTPNMRTHPTFGQALARAKTAGVELLALDCAVGPDFIEARDYVEVQLPKGLE